MSATVCDWRGGGLEGRGTGREGDWKGGGLEGRRTGGEGDWREEGLGGGSKVSTLTRQHSFQFEFHKKLCNKLS